MLIGSWFVYLLIHEFSHKLALQKCTIHVLCGGPAGTVHAGSHTLAHLHKHHHLAVRGARYGSSGAGRINFSLFGVAGSLAGPGGWTYDGTQLAPSSPCRILHEMSAESLLA